MFKKTSTVPSELPPPTHVDVPPIIPERKTFKEKDSYIAFPGEMHIIGQIPAAQKLADFLKENNIVLTPTVMNSECFILDGGIVVNDKPLIKIAVEYKK